MELKRLKSKKILILGFGREGIDNFLFLRKMFPKKILAAADKLKPEGLSPKAQNLIRCENRSRRIRGYWGENYLKALKKQRYDVIIKSPGIPFKNIPKSEHRKITSQTEIFFDNCPGKIIGVTGTKGKSTTAALIYHIFKKNRLRAYLIGNIGAPVFSALLKAKKRDIFIYELSSHQLHNLKKSPNIAIFLNICPEHLDWHINFNNYLKDKQNIALHQTKNDYFIFNPKDKFGKKTAKLSKGEKLPIKVPENKTILSAFKKSKLKGEFYLLNAGAATAAARILNLKDKEIAKAIESFNPLKHRLELAGVFKGITFYDDSIATNPISTIAAINTFKKKLETIILGGYNRGGINYKDLAGAIVKSNIKNLIFFPTTGEKIWKAIRFAFFAQGKKLPQHFFVDNMKKAVELCYKHTGKRKICLLSPASASFGTFRDYQERGDLFKKYIRKYARYAHKKSF